MPAFDTFDICYFVPIQEPASDNSPVTCNVCKHEFPTRNKLFDHIKKTGHAIKLLDARSKVNKAAAGSGKKSKRKGKKAENDF